MHNVTATYTPTMVRKIVLGVLVGLWLHQVGALLNAVTLWPVSLVWVVMFAWVILQVWRDFVINRGLVIIFVFVIYSIIRLSLLVQADYDRQRLPFLVIFAGFIGMIIVFIRCMGSQAAHKE